MIERVARAGLPTAQSYLVTDVAHVSALQERLRLPVMVKPSNSAGSDLCRAASTWADARAFAADVIDSTSILGNKNVGAVIQEFVEGPQFHVNTVVVDGVHEVTEVYSNEFRFVGDAPQLFAGRTHRHDEEGIAQLVEYVLACLEALGVHAGATHTEARLTCDGPRLIEFNGRLMGPAQPTDYFVAAQGFSQATVLADVIAGEPATARAALGSHPDRQFLGFYLLTAERSGVLVEFDPAPLRALVSFRLLSNAPDLGTEFDIENRTTDADLGLVLFANVDAEQLEDDLAEAERLERAGKIHRVEGVEIA
ncbi:hypothetical protein GCM10025867_06210 [Frondihabitans sucicola]|uniref:ATP-grasp domain-containing protein n=1 Tax=Frondihabitans sucicola TaxID=1268041 RepID=A0ABM8GJ45_9MICO|nr:ATP-grasp domain-containing protein [Frondihabitans sucicola]BDZ48380.1 hypothetical protein GCM10025867_06210 [Frondihabitans sucicola]